MPWKEIGLLAALLICFVLVRRFGKRHGDESRSARLMKKYATLTPELLGETPEEELVEAVVSHVLAKAADSRRPDPEVTLSGMPQPFTVVYSVWAVCKELANGSFAALTHTATRKMLEPAAEALPVIGATRTAAALTALQAAHTAKEDTEEAERAFHRAVESECPLALCAAYVRDHVPQLTGTDETESTDEA
ncbi:MAG: hypothetical protein IKU51_00080 [Clostridia bacterium]|nr:hypothetical protein [Clostridia bacterium]